MSILILLNFPLTFQLLSALIQLLLIHLNLSILNQFKLIQFKLITTYFKLNQDNVKQSSNYKSKLDERSLLLLL